MKTKIEQERKYNSASLFIEFNFVIIFNINNIKAKKEKKREKRKKKRDEWSFQSGFWR